MRFTIILFLILNLLIVGCSLFPGLSKNEDCTNAMNDIRKKVGEPEEVITYDSKDYHNYSWWYWKKGISYTFTWGKDFKKCEVTTYTFDPITKSWKLKHIENCPCGPII